MRRDAIPHLVKPRETADPDKNKLKKYEMWV